MVGLKESERIAGQRDLLLIFAWRLRDASVARIELDHTNNYRHLVRGGNPVQQASDYR